MIRNSAVTLVVRASEHGSLNHPRLYEADFFSIIDFSPETGIAGQDPAPLGFPGADFNDFNFDAIEVANDISDSEFETVLDRQPVAGSSISATTKAPCDTTTRRARSAASTASRSTVAGSSLPSPT